ncbi:MAG: DUF481 domain-containing protein [Sandaracinus sp.]|nr:DUF481 domain-containing protein [Sandaracinus sp.]MCB9611196.1 DUF481 domain-containing protein [Sandaracinus sp.]MCB9621052.1 DUF481 domain-containing protein [Sandaracinus sp.]MCB9630878.1 DUF481 domain-containing protein [Sandaracinus sp.]
MWRVTGSVWSLVSMLVGPSVALAQVNAEGIRNDAVLDHPSWSGGIEAGVTRTRGNVDFLDVGGGGRVEWQRFEEVEGSRRSLEHASTREGANVPTESSPQSGSPAPPWLRQRVFLSANARYARQADRTFQNRSFGHARWIAMWHRRVGSDVFAQVQFDELLRLRVRALAGFGARLVLVHRPVARVWAGTGAMLEHERIRVEEGATDDPRTNVARWTSYLALRVAPFTGRLILQNTTYVQPRFDALSDYRVLNELQLLAVVAPSFGSGLTCSVWHDRRPPSGVQRTDVRLLATLQVTLVSRPP